jgi:hypothetical protein
MKGKKNGYDEQIISVRREKRVIEQKTHAMKKTYNNGGGCGCGGGKK